MLKVTQKTKKTNKSKERTYEEFEKELHPKVPKTNYCGLLENGMDILRQMSWIEIEELTDYEFYGS